MADAPLGAATQAAAAAALDAAARALVPPKGIPECSEIEQDQVGVRSG